ncbi:6-aminohexanoate-cyclic-dimer hydrolase [Tsuneonella dongtanensis]|uniref:6-aminohexanoate-cyclic-dimer hydrolase n=1 Tax=Tsuneonella dongtanensis TaxID=692370 RepID=A0A1B2ABP4_9SPHN|nr:amidase [Tsuneonella dongtanensis]ANY19580.1 6-aminohexanoate-cyclic-dimer hydrolase [Tsuneonella dongtanensis]
MEPHAYAAHDATALAALVAAGETTPRALADAAIARIAALNLRINAVVETLYETIDDQIAALDPAAPFAGVPYLVKDLHTLVRGSRLTQGSTFLADHVSAADSDLVARLRRAGFVIIGRTNTPEFGLNAATEPRLHGATRNPYDTALSPGGSSGGAAAAVASGMVPAAHATDSGGSTRIPAAACGLVGLKPSRGRTFAGLDHGEGWSDIFHAHAVTRSVRDSAAILDATANTAAPAPYRAAPTGSFAAAADTAMPGLRIGVMRAPPSKLPVSAEYLAALDTVAWQCRALGHRTHEIAIEIDVPRYAAAFTLVLSSSVAATVAAHEDATGRSASAADFETSVWNAITLGRTHSAADLNRAVADLHLVAGDALSQIGDCDVVLSPTVARAPLPLGSLDTRADDFGAFLASVFAYAPFTSLWNGAGAPAISLPLAWSASGLPLGMQFVAHPGREDVLFALAGELERTIGWRARQDCLIAALQ